VGPYLETFSELPVLLKSKEGDNKNLGFWFIVTGFWLKEKTRNYKLRQWRTYGNQKPKS
jgi:hypothetical protein